MTTRWSPGVVVALCAALLAGTGGLRPASAAGDADAREHLAQERRSLEAASLEREQSCAAQFVVTACVEAARAQRREALAGLAAREAALDDAERRQRALDRQSRIAEKLARQAASAPEREPLSLVPAEKARRVRPAPASRAEPVPRATRSSPEEIEAREAEARARYDQRGREARRRQTEAAQRQRERERSGEPAAAPLPAVGASTAGSR